MTLRTLVVDDALVWRRIVGEALTASPHVTIVGSAGNGRAALERIAQLQPELVTLDIDMPVMNGLQVLDALRELPYDPTVVVVSALTPRGGRCTIQALEKGAFDYVTKPDTGSPQESRQAIQNDLACIIPLVVKRRKLTASLSATPPPSAIGPEAAAEPPRVPRPAERPELVVVGVSTGGPAALGRVIPLLPPDLGVPVVVVQHMPPLFTRSLAESLDRQSALAVREAADGEVLQPNVVYVAPGGHHMKVVPTPLGDKVAKLTDDPPEHHCRPAVDYLFRSVSQGFPGRAVGVVMTGMGSDGATGLRQLKRDGCVTIVQDETTSVVFGMPKAAIEAGAADVVVGVDGIAGRIVAAVRGHGR